MDFKEANKELKACLWKGGGIAAGVFTRIGDVSAITLIPLANMVRTYGPNSEPYGTWMMAAGAGMLAMRLLQNAVTNDKIRKTMSTNAIAVCAAQSLSGPLQPKPQALFFMPGALRRVLISEHLRRTVAQPAPGSVAS